ncbi:CD48 antigen-like [Heterodontus francisci]|uniref:CD48 antigen-like n=1 Tax=Heterodontus francisci TaxID=7792 RepID=UPI00355AFB67
MVTCDLNSLVRLLPALLSGVVGLDAVIINTPHYPVNGSLGQSVCLPVDIHPIRKNAEITWKFTGTNPQTTIARFDVGENKSKIFEGNQFEGRVTLHKNLTLQLDGVTERDEGIYKVIVTGSGDQEGSVSLHVYKPVSIPTVMNIISSSSTESCNVTLNCSTERGDHVVYMWAQIGPGDHIEQLSENTQHLELSLRMSDPISYRCTVSNPVSEQTTIFKVEFCFQQKTESVEMNIYIIISIIIIIIIIIIIVTYIVYRINLRRKSRCDKIEGPTPLDQRHTAAPNNYGNDDRPAESQTIYAVVQRPAGM